MGKDFEDIAREEQVTLDQTSKTPLFLVGEFENLEENGKKRGFFELDTGSDRGIVSDEFCRDKKLRVKKFKEAL